MESLYYFFGYPKSIITRKATQLFQYLQARQLRKLNRPELIPALKPNYQLGCKRIVFSSQYIQSIASPNVQVVRDSIKEVKPSAIVTENGRIDEFDIVVLGTGFKTQHGVLGNIKSKSS
jgi:cation diffusion facilitator CzcD-associated flavoprotein CzcO